jgi:hypothetical protein
MKLYEIMGEANRIATRERIKEILWMPFALCYTELVKTGDIPPLKDLDQKTKEKYWGETAGVKQEFYSKGRPVKRIWVASALYLYDLIKENDNPF